MSVRSARAVFGSAAIGIRGMIVVVAVAVAFPHPELAAQSRSPVCGDVNADTQIDLADPIWLLRYSLLGGSPPRCRDFMACADVNKDHRLDIGDPVYLLSYLIFGARSPDCSGVRGCTDPGARNYDASATIDDGSCEFDDPRIDGFTFAGRSAEGFAEYVDDSTGMAFVLLPGGEFVQGSPADECERSPDEGPQRAVELSPFLIAKYEVSQREWRDVMLANPSYFQPGAAGAGFLDEALLRDGAWLELPVENVSWTECREYCDRAGFELPTEAQWEYACRAGTTTAFASGARLDGAMGNYWSTASYCGESGAGDQVGRTVPVGELAPNAFGLHNLHGNVWEWCADAYDASAYASRGGDGVLDPRVDSESPGALRVLRGGGWFGVARYCRSANRSSLGPSVRTLQIGLRPVFPLAD